MANDEMIEAARKTSIVVRRGDLAWFRVVDEDRVRFLHSMLTNTVIDLSPGGGNRSALLSGKGKLLGELHVLVADDEVLVGTHPDCLERVYSTLDHHIIADEVELEHTDLVAVSVAGPEAAPIVEMLLGEDPALSPYAHAARNIGGHPTRITRLPWCGLPGLEVLVSETWAGDLVDAFAAAGSMVGDDAAAELLRLEHGRPGWGHELTENTLPLEAGMDETLHRTKGCYLGQETIVRVLSRGHVNWHIRGLRLEGEVIPSQGDEVFVEGESKVRGAVTSAARSPTLGAPIALVRIRRELAEPGTAVLVRTETGEVPARVVEGPFVDPTDP